MTYVERSRCLEAAPLDRAAYAGLFVLLIFAVPADAQTGEARRNSPCLCDADRPITERQIPPLLGSGSITRGERVGWIVDGIVGPPSLGVGVLAGALQTSFDTPKEWHRTWRGFGKRYLAREADVAISNTIEGGLGAMWGEDPRYLRSERRGLWPRARYAMKTVVLAPRRDGHLAPAWGRFAGNIVNNIIENRWLPPSVTTPGQTTLRSANGFLGRLAGNLWDEFWPDVRKRLGR
jgi:hypothetical protein